MSEISNALYKRLRHTLLQCEAFESNNRLNILFDDERLAPWRDDVPETRSRAERVDAIIHFLIEKHLHRSPESALVLLLMVLRDRIDREDARYQQYSDLIREMHHIPQDHNPETIQTNENTYSVLERKNNRTIAFMSYSDKDKKYMQELYTHLKYYIRLEELEVWDSTKILPGSHRREELEHALQSTKVAILLLSADFFASDFIIDHQLSPLVQIAKKEEVTLLPVILKSCGFEHSMLAQFQSVNLPSQPLALMEPAKRDMVWSSLAERIWKILTGQ